MAIETPADLIASVGNGTLTILDRPDFLSAPETAALHLANSACMNGAIALFEMMLGAERQWTWAVGYDNLAVLTHPDKADPIRCISLSPAHALALATLMARFSGTPSGLAD